MSTLQSTGATFVAFQVFQVFGTGLASLCSLLHTMQLRRTTNSLALQAKEFLALSPVLLARQGGQRDRPFQVVQVVPLSQGRQARPWDQVPQGSLELLPGLWDQGHLHHPVLTVTANSDCTQKCTYIHTHLMLVNQSTSAN